MTLKHSEHCSFCSTEFKPKTPDHIYCSNSCRMKAYNLRKNVPKNEYINAYNNEPPTRSKTHINDVSERIIDEREQVFSSRLKVMEAQFENRLMELRLVELEKKIKELEKEPEPTTIAGIPTEMIAQMAVAYFTNKMNSNGNNTTKEETQKV